MKQVPPIFYDDKDFGEIKSLKDELESNWHDFILDLVRFKRQKMKGGKK